MDAKRKFGAKKQRGNLVEDGRTANREPDPVTKIKSTDLIPQKKADLKEQKRRLHKQGRSVDMA